MVGTTTLPPPPARGKPPPGPAMPFDPAKFVAAVAAEMTRHGVTRADLARRSGLSLSAVSRLLDGHRDPTAASLAKLLPALGRSWGWLDAVAPLDPAPSPPATIRTTAADNRARARAMREAKVSVAAIAAALNVSRSTANNYVRGVKP